ncbi:SETMAR [Cordylochernes scorpioides]|uniref:SETMAR n=1 Tax=Cordylochernes scorpioides TaxID=51811 RepID=A0ABY6KUI8_9ARAC|nr:SETMAR [Cordylochernes scorpioides]
MAISEPKSAHLRDVLLFAFNLKKSATEAHRMLEEVYGDHALSKSQCYRWFKKFQSGDFKLDNEPRGKPPRKFEEAELQALLDEDSTQTLEKLAKQLQVSQGAVSLRLNSLGMTQKLSRWVPHELSERQQERRLVTCEGLLARHENNSFCTESRGACPANFQNRRLGPIASEKKAMLCVWWDQTGVVYFELLKPGEMVNTSRYEQQMHSLREALNEKRPEWREKHNKLILQHDNVPAHNATMVKNTIKHLGWELLPHPLYSPDLAPSDYHLFTSLGHALKNQESSNSDILRKWLVDWFDSKRIKFFRQGIRKLPERWSECLKMEYPGGKNQHFRKLLFFAFHPSQKVAEAAQDICNVYGIGFIEERAAQKWFAKFKNGDLDLEDTLRSGRPSEFDLEHLKALLKEDGRPPDLAPTDYHLLHSMSNHMRGTTFDDEEDLKTWLNNFFDTRSGDFWRNGINKLVEIWEEVVNNNG